MIQFAKINVVHHINSLKKKIHVTISTDEERTFDNIQDPFMTKTSLKKRNRRKHSQPKGHLQKTKNKTNA